MVGILIGVQSVMLFSTTKKSGEKQTLPRVEALSEGFARRLGA
jgi:hypothetical protein